MTTHRCPDEETLAAYFDGLLEPAQEAALHRELIGCPDCSRLVAALGLAVEAELTTGVPAHFAVPAHVTQRAMDLFPQIDREPLLKVAIRWIGEQLAPLAEALQPLGGPATAMRGAANAAAGRDDLRYQVDLGDVPVEIDLEVDGPEQIAVTVRPLGSTPPGLILRLSADGQTRAMSSLTDDGATLPALPPATYALTLERAGAVIGSIELDLGG